MTCFLFGTIIFTILYLFNRFKHVNVINEDKTFTKSPNSHPPPVVVIHELTPIEDVEEKPIEKMAKDIVNDINEVSKSAVSMLNEVVTEATKVANAPFQSFKNN